MPEPSSPNRNDEPRYRIGAVCRLTGISPHALRVWEKRYRAVEPARSETRLRLYRDRDINRLTLLKALVDRGQAIGSIAGLDDAELERRLQQTGHAALPGLAAAKPALALFGETLATSVGDDVASESFILVGRFDQPADYDREKSTARLDVAVVEWPGLHPQSVSEAIDLVDRLNARHLVLVYDYAPRALLRRLPKDRITALRSPLDFAVLEAVVAWRFGLFESRAAKAEDRTGITAARRFDDRELAHLAAQSPAIACECPMHLAQLISRLVHFEAYSAECESRDDRDAALHAYLHNTTSQARSMMERALVRVVELENLSLEPD